MNQNSVLGHMVHVVELDFQVVNRLGEGPGGGGEDAGGAVEGEQALAGDELVRPDEFLAVLGPERMVGRWADGVGQALDSQVDDVG